MSARSSASEPRLSRIGDRLSGAVVLLFAVALWAVVIPDQVDSASYGWMRPRTMPTVAAVAMGLFGALLVIFPSARPVAVSVEPVLRIGAVGVLAGAAVLAFGVFPFIVVAPLAALGLALMIGERSWPWLAAATVGVPGVIWLVVGWLLGRPLP